MANNLLRRGLSLNGRFGNEMLSSLRSARSLLQKIKTDFSEILSSIRYKRRFCTQLREYLSMSPDESISIYPCLNDWSNTTPIEPTYFYQDSWAFDLIVKAMPESHVDIGSHHKYVALLSKVIPVTMVDIRPLSCMLDSIEFKKGSILAIPFSDKSISSLSSLCVIEHIGLGRYGDPLDPNGSIKACAELSRVIAPGGNLYISVPIEKHPRTYFNAHRSFNEESFLALFPEFSLKDKAYIYGNSFTRSLMDHFGIGCYHLSRMTRYK